MADKEPLRVLSGARSEGFETLQGLCDDGWKVVYLTAKPAVHEEMAGKFDCMVHELELQEG